MTASATGRHVGQASQTQSRHLTAAAPVGTLCREGQVQPHLVLSRFASESSRAEPTVGLSGTRTVVILAPKALG